MKLKKGRLYNNTPYGYIFVKKVGFDIAYIETLKDSDIGRLYHHVTRSKKINWKEIKQIRI